MKIEGAFDSAAFNHWDHAVATHARTSRACGSRARTERPHFRGELAHALIRRTRLEAERIARGNSLYRQEGIA